jgi:cholesterol transport system auxiliary component
MRALPLLGLCASFAGCGSLLETSAVAPQSYVLRLPPPPAAPPDTTAGSLLVQRPDAGPGLESERIVLVRSEHRFDFYAAAQWAAPAPDIVSSVMVDALRAGGKFRAVFDDHSPYAPRYNLRCGLRRFEADYTNESGGAGGAAPTVHVALDCTLGRHRDRTLLGNFVVEGSSPAAEDRLSAVVAAFDKATQAAMQSLSDETAAALAREEPPAAN